jgi:threonine/homoserine/homoserine lactone efflux protein
VTFAGVQCFPSPPAATARRFDVPAGRPGRSGVREGYAVGLSDPTALIAFVAVLPRFVDRAAENVLA